MSAFEVLSRDHARLLDLADQLTSGSGDPPGSPKVQRRLAERLVIEASMHEAVEEQFFWPAVRDRLEEGTVLAFAGIDQEMQNRKLLHELNRTGPGNDTFMTMVFSVASQIRTHLTYEESQLWPKLQLVLGPDELERLDENLSEAKATAPTRPHPHSPPDAKLLQVIGPWLGKADRALDRLTLRGR